MLSQWQLLSSPNLSSYLAILVVVTASWILVSFWRAESKSPMRPDGDMDSERWLCRTLFGIKSEGFRVGPGELVSAVCPVKKDWIFAKNCRTEEMGWLPQSSLELVKGSGSKIENARLKVMFKDNHFPIDSPPKEIAEGIIWCIFVFSPEDDLDDIPDLGNLKSHVAIVVLSKSGRKIRVGGPQRINIEDKIESKLDQNDFLESFSYIHTRLHPQRLIVIINAAECPLPVLSGKWHGGESPDWMPIEQTAKLLARVHLRTPIAILILNSPRKASLSTLHLFYQCCSVLVAAQEIAAMRFLHPDTIQMLLYCPDIPLENLISIFVLSFKMVAFNCDVYPKAAIVIKSFLNSVLSAFYFLSESEKKAFYHKLHFRSNCSNGMLVDEYVDILGLCSAAKATLPNLYLFHELERNLCACISNMVITSKGDSSSGLWVHMPTGLTLAENEAVFSQYDTYRELLTDFYSFYDFLPRLQKRIATVNAPIKYKTPNNPVVHYPA